MPPIFKQSSRHTVYLLLFAVAFVFYGNTISNQYALDDSIVITENKFTRQGIEGIDDILKHDSFTGFFGKQKKLVSGGRYRPLSIVTFALEYELFGKNPHVSHFINVFLFGLTGVFIFLIFSSLFWHVENRPWYLSLAFLTALLFIAHPVHTETVANIKGRDEILSFLFALLALFESIRYTREIKLKYLILSFIFFLLALMSKENAITFLAVVPLTLYFFRQRASGSISRPVLITLIPLALATILYLAIRFAVLGFFTTEPPNELMNNPFLHATLSEKYGTIFLTLGYYLKLLFYPHPLTFDYYPYHISLVEITNIKAVVPLVVYLGITAYAIVKLKSKSIISYSILYYLITLSIVSNLFFPVGTFMNERFLYMPSLGFSIILAYIISHSLYQAIKPEHFRPLMILVFVLGILVFSGFKIIRRNQDWKNNFTLFTHDVMISSNSAKSNTSAGGVYLENAIEMEDSVKKKQYLEKSIHYLRKALDIHPKYTDANVLLGNAWYHYNLNIDSTLFYYSKVLEKNSNYSRLYKNMKGIVGDQRVDIDQKISVCKTALRYNPDSFYFHYKLGKFYAQHKNRMDEGIRFLKKAVEIKPESVEALKDLGVAYGLQKQYKQSIDAFDRALELSPNDPQLYINQGINYRQTGKESKAAQYFRKARELQQEKDDKR